MAHSYDYNDKLSFISEWFDYEAARFKKFLLNYYPSDNTIELFDIELNRLYLKRAICEDVDMKDMFLGNTVRIYGRQIKITDYADGRTKEYLGKHKQHTFAMIKPLAFKKCGEIINLIEEKQFRITNLKMCHLSQNQVVEFYQSDEKDLALPFIVENMIAGPLIALELVGDDAIERWKKTIGPEDPLIARQTNPDSLRALYGLEKFSNGFHGSENLEAYRKEYGLFFLKPVHQNVSFENSTCCVIKPHAIREGKLGLIVDEITSKFKITAMQMFDLTKPNAEEFLEVYHNVIDDFRALLMSFLDGPCVALAISGVDNVHSEFRKFVGPHDSEIARQIRPNTLRAKYGIDKYKNAVHCTDLEEDTTLELEFFFQILS